MKRFFRTSKFGVDPLPPPQPAQPEPPQLQQQLQGLAVVEAKHPKSSFVPGEQLESKMRFSNHPKGGSGGGTTGSVTPFPIEIGREQPAPQMKGKEKNTARSLMEIQQLQGQSDVSRRDEWVQTQRKPERGPRPAQTEMIIGGAPDDWSGKNERSKASDGHDPPLFLPPAPNLHNVAPMANHSLINGSTPTPSQPALFLPPGARPSSSPTALRPGTPTRPSYTESLGHSQSSILTSPGPGPPLEPYPPSSMTGSRDRGYSSASASARESDLDSSAHGHVSAPVPLSNGKHPKQSFPPAPVRSPLANSYEFPGVSNPILPLPKSASPLQPLPTTNTQPFNDLKEVKLSIGPDGRDDDGDTPKAMERDKKKFWGMGRKDKTKDRRDSAVPNRSYEDARQSAEFWRNDGVALSSLVQGEDEYRGEHRGRLQQGSRPLRQEDSVTTAISMCTYNVNSLRFDRSALWLARSTWCEHIRCGGQDQSLC